MADVHLSCSIQSTFGDEKGIGLTITFVPEQNIWNKLRWLETFINCSIFSLFEFKSFWFRHFWFIVQKFTATCQSRIWNAFKASYVVWFTKIFRIFQQNIKWNIIMFICDLDGLLNVILMIYWNIKMFFFEWFFL